jgi:precorrin-6B methylase 2
MRVIVSCQDVDVNAVLSRLTAEGMKVDTVLAAIGVITGEIAAEHLATFEKIDGISIEADKNVQLSPPDSPIQ